jgi:hypothetical protein
MDKKKNAKKAKVIVFMAGQYDDETQKDTPIIKKVCSSFGEEAGTVVTDPKY